MAKRNKDPIQDSEITTESEEEKEDSDGPRVVQWVDEEDLVQGKSDDSSDNEEDSENEGSDDERGMRTLQNNLSDLPFGALQKAQRVLAQTTADSDSEDSEDGEAPLSEGEGEPSRWVEEQGSIGREQGPRKSKKDIAKRKDKHAPTEVTSKRPVPRRRTIVEVPKMEVRDPRFIPLTGEFDAAKFRTQYNFIADMHLTELKTLRDNLKRARKMLASSPHDLREEREREVEKLELAVKRSESMVNRDKREKIEQEALRKVTKEEREKRAQGKGDFWIKSSAKKDILLKARYEAIAADGGKRAVKKAIEKKQKKVGQKETKSRPFARGEAFSGRGDGEKSREMGKRQFEGQSHHPRGGKRRKVT